MYLKSIGMPMLAVLLGVAGVAWSAPAAGAGQDRGGWDAPPRGLQQLERRGFQDGIEGARKDFGNHRQPDVNNREEYRHPDMPRQQWDAYQRGFRRGYQQAAAHLWGGPAAPPPVMNRPGMAGPGPAYGDRDGDRGPGGEVRQRGLQEGMEGALRDFSNHRALDVNNREEYRHPDMPYAVQEPYRDGFRRGYRVVAQELMSGNGTAYGPAGDMRLRGFQDGMEGALRDFGNHRAPDPNNRDEYRHPNVPYPAWELYRDGFRRGYRVAMSQLTQMPVGR